MKRAVAGLISIALAAEVIAVVLLRRELVVLAAASVVAAALLALRWLSVRDAELAAEGLMADGPAESLKRWLSRTETLVSRADSTRRDWDRHMRPMLARQFEMATGQRKAKDRSSFESTGLMLFGPQLWEWVDPENISRTGADEPGPGRTALDEILQRLERV